MGNAVVQVHTLSNKKAIFRTLENLRKSKEFTDSKIQILEDNMSEISFANPKIDNKKNIEIGKKINAINSNIRTYQKRILPETSPKKIEKMNLKINDYRKQIDELKSQKNKKEETRGRKKIQFVELIFSLPGVSPDNQFMSELFATAQQNYLSNFFFKNESIQIVSNAVHLDQYSLHSHAILKLPAGESWSDFILRKMDIVIKNKDKKLSIKEALGKAYGIFARHFQHEMGKELEIDFDELSVGKIYKSLSKYKKENPLLPPEAPINPQIDEEEDIVAKTIANNLRKREANKTSFSTPSKKRPMP